MQFLQKVQFWQYFCSRRVPMHSKGHIYFKGP